MKKIPTVFERDWEGDRSRVIDKVHPGCEWVLAGEGLATRKLDGTCCMIRGGKLYKRRELRSGDVIPPDFERVDHDDETGKTIGWVPVGDDPGDRWHREAFQGGMGDGTYELIGPKINGNPERIDRHALISHGHTAMPFNEQPTRLDFAGLRDWLTGKDIEGVVFYHPPTKQRAKLKLRDFGLKRIADPARTPHIKGGRLL